MSGPDAVEPSTKPTVPLVVPPSLPSWAAEFVEVGGLRTRYFRAGRGPRLLLIPSAFLRASSYKGTIEALALHFEVIAAEAPGSGRSANVKHPRGFEETADWAAGFLDAVGWPKALVVGHSDTGGAAALMGVRHPDRMTGLVLADSVGARPGAGWFKLGVGRFLDGLLHEARLNLPLGPQALAGLARHPKNWLYHAFVLAPHDRPLEVADQIKVPTLLAWGRKDHTFPPECAERLLAAIPNCRVAWSEKGSHDWIILRPREFAEIVAGFGRELGLLAASPPA